MAYKIIEMEKKDLFEYKFEDEEPCLYNIYWNSVKYEFLIKYRKKSKDAALFGTGAIARGTQLPIFSRGTWMNDFPCTCIFYADPTYYETEKASLLWYYGKVDDWYLERISFLTYVLLKKMNIELENTCYFGSSGGGYSSLVMATLLKSRATVINPQCDISTFSKAHYDNFLYDVAGG